MWRHPQVMANDARNSSDWWNFRAILPEMCMWCQNALILWSKPQSKWSKPLCSVGPMKMWRGTLESSSEGSCSLFSKQVNTASGVSSPEELGSGPIASGLPSLGTAGCPQDRFLGGPLGAAPCSSDSFNFSSKRNARSYHEQGNWPL